MDKWPGREGLGAAACVMHLWPYLDQQQSTQSRYSAEFRALYLYHHQADTVLIAVHYTVCWTATIGSYRGLLLL